MKKNLLLMVLLLSMLGIQAQQVGINTVNPEATLDVRGNSSDPATIVQGIIPNRITTAQRDAMVNPPEGTCIYNTTEKCF